jgi:aminopeptidase N
VHEIAHQWFFNLVGNDQVNEPWLDEAVAQYAVGLYYEDAYGSQGTRTARDWWFGNWSRVGREETPIGLPVAAYEASAYSPIVYGRGPFFLADLEDTFSQAAFAAFLEDYVLTFAWDIATTAAFRALAEEHCGCDLGPRFETWVCP